jgi:glycosyltransferase involved in cell wall biosynthesis
MTFSASIVFTTFNSERFIETSLRAALDQGIDRYEVIAVDDGSTDQTLAICRKFSDPRLRIIEAGKCGRARALNVAIAAAQGEYIAINDADDRSLPDRLGIAVSFLQRHPEVVLLGTEVIATETFTSTLPAFAPSQRDMEIAPTWIDDIRLYRNNPFIHSTTVFRKSIWAAVGGYDEKLSICVDYDFFLRTKPHGSIAWLPQPTVYYFVNRTSFFKRKPLSEYLCTLRYIRRRAKKSLRLPFWTCVYDLLPWYSYASTAWARWQTSR